GARAAAGRGAAAASASRRGSAAGAGAAAGRTASNAAASTGAAACARAAAGAARVDACVRAARVGLHDLQLGALVIEAGRGVRAHELEDLELAVIAGEVGDGDVLRVAGARRVAGVGEDVVQQHRVGRVRLHRRADAVVGDHAGVGGEQVRLG